MTESLNRADEPIDVAVNESIKASLVNAMGESINDRMRRRIDQGVCETGDESTTSSINDQCVDDSIKAPMSKSINVSTHPCVGE